MTNSPPPIVPGTIPVGARVLASGFDTLVLALDVAWQDDSFLLTLGELKRAAADSGEDQALLLSDAEGQPIGPFAVKPYGVRGYEWLLTSADCTMRIGRWLQPGSRPGVMLELGSEVLWRLGAEVAVRRALEALEAQGGHVVVAKASRVDVCLDVLLPRSEWSPALLPLCVCLARSRSMHLSNSSFSGLSLGRGVVVARLYDKALEIATKSRDKAWMYRVWGLESVPEGHVVARIEFQLRREALKSLQLETIQDVFGQRGRVWAYCTEQWLELRADPGKQHHQRETLDWWRMVQRGFDGAQPGNALLREAAVNVQRKQLEAQLKGFASSLAALRIAETVGPTAKPEEMTAAFHEEMEKLRKAVDEEGTLSKEVVRKLARYQRGDGRPLRVRPSSATEEKIIEVKEDEPCPF